MSTQWRFLPTIRIDVWMNGNVGRKKDHFWCVHRVVLGELELAVSRVWAAVHGDGRKRRSIGMVVANADDSTRSTCSVKTSPE